MVSHVVLFRPRAGLSREERVGLIDALAKARRDIPGIRGFKVGRRLTHSAGYGQLTPYDFPFVAVIDFDDVTGLQTYLEHPAHAEVARMFAVTLEAALVDDYETSEDLASVRKEAEEA